MPVGRGVLEAETVLAAGHAPTAVVLATPDAGTPEYRRYERLQGEAFAATVQALSPVQVAVTRVDVADARNAPLVTKYSIVRDYPALPRDEVRSDRLHAVLASAINAAARLRDTGRRRRRALIMEYRPTQGFARLRSPREVPAVLQGFPLAAVGSILRAGDRAMHIPPGATGVRDAAIERALAAFVAGHAEELRTTLAFDGRDLWPLVEADLLALTAEYADWLRGAAPTIARTLRTGRVGSVLVPFDTPPFPRLIVRTAQARGIPTFVLNDGWKGDDFGQQGMTADVALASSENVLRNYFRRHPNADRAILTGDPRSDAEHAPVLPAAPHAAPRRILLGSFTFSPIDLNCRRSDPERFLEVALEAIAASPATRGAQVVFKLHPADRADAYDAIVARHPDVAVEVVSAGDVTALFADADVYITTYSTSLLQAAGVGLPCLYLAVNEQRLHAPFAPDDPFLGPRTAHDAAELAALLGSPAARTVPDATEREAWLRDVVGPDDGRCTARVAAAVGAPLR
jgi:hypothetical protein